METKNARSLSRGAHEQLWMRGITAVRPSTGVDKLFGVSRAAVHNWINRQRSGGNRALNRAGRTIQNRRRVRVALIAAVALTFAIASFIKGAQIGGYVYNGESRFVDNVWNFIKHFPYQQYYWAAEYEFKSANNYYVDAMDLSYYSGHGSPWYITTTAYPSQQGLSLSSGVPWGDYNLEFIIFQSCAVVPSVPEGDWWSNWTGAGRAFQGLHQAIGYRTESYSGNGISDNYGGRVAGGQAMWQAWFNAVNDERSWWRGSFYPGYASVVLYPGLDNDTLYSFGADPPAGSGSLRTYYQY